MVLTCKVDTPSLRFRPHSDNAILQIKKRLFWGFTYNDRYVINKLSLYTLMSEIQSVYFFLLHTFYT